MADHNGDYSPEAEYRRKQKREKVQRARLRKKIDEGRASNAEIRAMNAWDDGGVTWDDITQALAEIRAEDRVETARPVRAPRSPRAATRETEATQGEQSGSWPAWVSWAGLAAFVGACVWIGLRSV